MPKSNDQLKSGLSIPGAVMEDEWMPPAVRQNTILSASARGLVTSSGLGGAQRRLNISRPAAGHMRFTLPGAVEDDEECSPTAVRQSTILSASACGLVSGSSVGDAQRRLNIFTPAAGHVRCALLGAVEDYECRGEARGFVTNSGVCDARWKSNISTTAAGHVKFAVDDEECSRAAVRQNTILSTSACGLVTGSSARDVRQRSNISTPAASQESITPPRAAKKEERRKKKADKKPKQQKGKSISAFFRRTVQAIQHACCICQNEDDLESSDSDDPQPGPSNLLSSTREDPTDLQKGPSGLKHTGFQEPAYCLAGSFTLEETEIQEETDHNQGPFDPAELRAQPDQAFCKPGPFGLHGAREQDSPFGLERARHEEPAYCLAGSYTLEETEIQEETDHNQGPFDPAELRAQPDQAFCKPGPFGLHGAREQDSPFGLERARHEEPAYCQAGSFTLEKKEIQEETDLETDLEPAGCHKPGCCPPGSSKLKPKAQDQDPADSQPGPSGLQSAHSQNSPLGLEPAGCHKPGCCPPGSSELKPKAQDQDPADSQPGPSGLQSSGPADSQPARAFQMLYTIGKLIGRGGFGTIREGCRKSDGRKVAIKFIEKSCPSTNSYIKMPGHAEPLYTEVAINLMLLQPKKSPYIVEMLDWFEERNQYIIILELPHPCMNLLEFVESNGGRLSEVQARPLMRQAVLAAIHCIDRGVYHGDLKLDNMLVNTDTMELKLIDFGLSNLANDCGRRGAPYRGLYFADEQTMHALAILLFKMLHGQVFRGRTTEGTAVISKECQDLIDWSLDLQRGTRPTLKEFFQHKWFN
ncbi:uncharacterized protein [Misgurnus anguillicaudatus]|uniref:uncharacterized protein n=1 Tax=Misgurnus anguillicaudatus TaxID=75329 RepID=UPI003CCFA5F1